jgi:hypothetical protein
VPVLAVEENMKKLLLFLGIFLLSTPCFSAQILVGDSTGTWYSTTSSVGIGTINPIQVAIVGGTSSQFMKADGSLDGTAYVSGTPWTGLGYITLSSLSGTSPITYSNGVVGIGTTGTWNGNAVTATSATSATTAGTVTTAAQSNITSVGTLTGLMTSGNVGVGTTLTGNNVLTVYGGNIGVGTTKASQSMYVVGSAMFTTGINIGIGTASLSHLCVQNTVVSKCP